MELSKSYIETDRNLENDGVDVELEDGGFITVRRTNNEQFAGHLRTLRKPYERRIQRATAKNAKHDPELQKTLDDLTRKAVAKYVLIGWRGIKIDGKEVKYSPSKAEELMKKFDGFQEDVLLAANSEATFAAEVKEENAKNS